jgi:uncharacterized protein (TIGR03437 family)
LGVCTIQGNKEGNQYYLPSPTAAASFNVIAGPLPPSTIQTIVFPSIPNLPLGTSPFLLAIDSVPTRNLTLVSNTPAVCTLTGKTVTVVTPGLCSITASQSGDATYLPATPVTRTFMVTGSSTPQPQNITFPPIVDRYQNDFNFSPLASASSGLPVTYTSQTPETCTIVEMAIDIKTLGICTVTAQQAGNNLFLPAPPVTRSFNILTPKLFQYIAFPALPARPLGGAPFSINVTASSGLPVTLSSMTLSMCSVNGNVVTLLGVGFCSITASQPGNSAYDAASTITQGFYVTTGLAQTIEFSQPSSHALQESSWTPAATASSGLTVTFTASPGNICFVSGESIRFMDIGQCTVTAAQGGDGVYSAATPVTRVFAITSAVPFRAQSITFPPSSARKVGDNFALTATASSGLPVTYILGSPAICSLSGSIVTMIAAGQCVITATQSGDAIYHPATNVVQAFTATAPPVQQSQTINFGSLPGRMLGAVSFGIAATASSGLAVTLTSNTPSVCTLVGALVTLVSAGQCSITATQPGNTSLTAATPVTQTFTVSAAPTGQIAPLIDAIQEAGGYAPGKIAPSSYAVVRGEHFLPSPQVKLRDMQGVERTLEQIFAVDTQINVVIPSNVPVGNATVIVSNANGASEFPVTVSAIAPGIFTANATGGGFAAAHVVVVKDGQNTTTLLAETQIAMQPGTEVLIVLYGTGIRGHSPNGVTARVGALSAEVVYAGPQGTYPAMDQVNIKLPAGIGSGTKNIQITVDGVPANVVTAVFQ